MNLSNEQQANPLSTKTNGTILFEKHGVTYTNLTQSNLSALLQLAHSRMQEKGYIQDFQVSKNPNFLPKAIKTTCSSNYFDDRELFTFYTNNEVGVAGWASGVIKQELESILNEWCETTIN